jgi:hypothetical protein
MAELARVSSRRSRSDALLPFHINVAADTLVAPSGLPSFGCKKPDQPPRGPQIGP